VCQLPLAGYQWRRMLRFSLSTSALPVLTQPYSAERLRSRAGLVDAMVLPFDYGVLRVVDYVPSLLAVRRHC
jgi:hypothetical protein